MKLIIDCTWNEKQNRAKLVICFDYLPKNIFSLPKQQAQLVQTFRRNAAYTGPSVLSQLKEVKNKYPKSLYTSFIYHQTLKFFEYEEEADELFLEIQEKFPEQVFTNCMTAAHQLKQQKHEEFIQAFQGMEVLKGAFPRRKQFFFEEALFFHSLWAKYYFENEIELKHKKHIDFIHLIINSLSRSFKKEEESENL